MTSSVRVLSTATLDSSPSLLLVAPDGSKVLIDCGEGCQRAFIEYAQKLTTVQGICLTQLSNETLGGLPGVFLTLSDSLGLDVLDNQVAASSDGGPRSWPFYPLRPNDTAHLHLFGPKGSVDYIRSLRHFSRRSKFKLMVYEDGNDEKREALPRTCRPQKKKPNQLEKQTRFFVTSIPFQEQVGEIMDQRAGQKRPYNGFWRKTLSYLFTTPPLVGKFLPQKAQELGVPKGNLYSELKSGKSVTFLHAETNVETTVHSDQVVTPSSPGLAVLVIRYPQSPAQLEQFFAALKISERLAKTETKLDVIVHLALPQVFSHAVSREWKATQVDEDVQHLWMNLEKGGKTPHRSAAFTANIRAEICPQVFQAPWKSGNAGPYGDTTNTTTGSEICQPGLEFTLLPRRKRGLLPPVLASKQADVEVAQMKQLEESGARELAEAMIQEHRALTSSSRLDTHLTGKLLFAGTASSLPCKYRNVTGMQLSNMDGRSMLLDVGEGTVGQLLRMQSSEPNIDKVLSKITTVWISHPHADHHLGLLRLLEQRRAADPILLIGPLPIYRFLREYASSVDPRISQRYRFLDCRDFLDPQVDAIAAFKEAVGFTSCRSLRVDHCAYAYAVIVDGTPFGRVVYSGDCRPCAKLAEIAKGADVLIHESTFEDSMKSEAFLKKHCTIGEALQISKSMDAKCTVLTHFSQRYPRIPPPTEVVDTTGMQIVFAFDYQILSPETLSLAANLTPILRKLYPDENEEDGRDDDKEDINKDATSQSKAAAILSTPGLFANSTLL